MKTVSHKNEELTVHITNVCPKEYFEYFAGYCALLKEQGSVAVFVSVLRNDKIVLIWPLALSGFKHRELLRFGFGWPFRNVWRKITPSIYCMNMPIIKGKFDEDKTTSLIKQAFEDFFIKNKILYSSFRTIYYDESYTFLKNILIHLDIKQTDWATFVIDLSQDESVLWENLSKKARTPIRSAEKLVEIKELSSSEEFKSYVDAIRKFAVKEGIKPTQEKFYNLEFRHLHNSKFWKAHYILAYSNGELLSGLAYSEENDRITQGGLFRTEADYKHKANSTDLLEWHIIKWAKKHSYKYYDLVGVNPNPAEGSKDMGIYRFKSKWGGKLCDVDVGEKYYGNNRFYYPLIIGIYNLLKR